MRAQFLYAFCFVWWGFLVENFFFFKSPGCYGNPGLPEFWCPLQVANKVMIKAWKYQGSHVCPKYRHLDSICIHLCLSSSWCLLARARARVCVSVCFFFYSRLLEENCWFMVSLSFVFPGKFWICFWVHFSTTPSLISVDKSFSPPLTDTRHFALFMLKKCQASPKELGEMPVISSDSWVCFFCPLYFVIYWTFWSLHCRSMKGILGDSKVLLRVSRRSCPPWCRSQVSGSPLWKFSHPQSRKLNFGEQEVSRLYHTDFATARWMVLSFFYFFNFF